MWLAVKQPSTQHKKEFPYQALNPVTQESVVIENMQQINGMLMDCYDEAKQKVMIQVKHYIINSFSLQIQHMYMIQMLKTLLRNIFFVTPLIVHLTQAYKKHQQIW